MKRTNVNLDEELVKEGLELTHFKTIKELVNHALKEFIAWKKRSLLLEWEGKVEFFEDYDYKDLRQRHSS
ncbi:MAG: type II toxin-antitoxin system VapB family antitoxin [bacterium]